MAKKATVPPPASPAADAFRASLRRKEPVDVFGWRFFKDRRLMMSKILEASDLIVQVHSLIKGDPLNEPVEDTLAAADGLKYVWQVLHTARIALSQPIEGTDDEYDLFRIATVLYNSTIKEYKIADAKLDMYLSCE
jgi:hypothetical protein